MSWAMEKNSACDDFLCWMRKKSTYASTPFSKSELTRRISGEKCEMCRDTGSMEDSKPLLLVLLVGTGLWVFNLMSTVRHWVRKELVLRVFYTIFLQQNERSEWEQKTPLWTWVWSRCSNNSQQKLEFMDSMFFKSFFSVSTHWLSFKVTRCVRRSLLISSRISKICESWNWRLLEKKI